MVSLADFSKDTAIKIFAAATRLGKNCKLRHCVCVCLASQKVTDCEEIRNNKLVDGLVDGPCGARANFYCGWG